MIDIADIKASIQSGTLIQDKFFKNADFLKDKRGRLITYTGGYTIVIPANIKGEKWALRCWHTPVKDAKKRYALIGKAITKSKFPYFCSFDYAEKGLVIKGESYPITKMHWIEGLNLKKYICTHYQNSDRIKKLAKNFLKMVADLHSYHIAHGDLQHGNIIISDSGKIFLVDYDSMYVPEMRNQYRDIITGLVDYQHPSRKSNITSSYKLDYFSEVVIYTSLLGIALNPKFVNDYNVEDSEALLFTSKDFDNLTSSQIYKDLKALKNEDIDKCLDILQIYLSSNDINSLYPIETYFMAIKITCPTFVPQNEIFIMKWSSTGAERVEISEIGEVPLEGNKAIKLSTSKTIIFTLVASNGYKSIKSIRVNAAPRAFIKYFKADKEYTLDTVPVEITWDCGNAKKVEIIGVGTQASSGKIIVTPKEETTYILCVEDDFGIQKREITIKKLPLPLIKEVLVPAPNIERHIDITYQVPKFHLFIPTPTFKTNLCRIDLPHIPKLNGSLYFVQSIDKGKNLKSQSIFKSLFSIFSQKNKKDER